MAIANRWERLVGGIGRPAPLVVTPVSASARARRRRKKPAPERDDRPHPTPAFSWHPWECKHVSLWNCLRFGPWTEFDLRTLARSYGFTWDSPTSSATC